MYFYRKPSDAYSHEMDKQALWVPPEAAETQWAGRKEQNLENPILMSGFSLLNFHWICFKFPVMRRFWSFFFAPSMLTDLLSPCPGISALTSSYS